MSNYFSSLKYQDGVFFGLVYSAANNNVVYQTNSYPTQEQVNLEIAEFLKTNEPPIVSDLPQIETSVVNSLRSATQGCCGKG